MSTIEVTELVGNEGTILVFAGADIDTGERVTFAADHRAARPLADAVIDGEYAEVEIPSYLVISRSAA